MILTRTQNVRPAFTLVELLVVIGIIGRLISFLLPATAASWAGAPPLVSGKLVAAGSADRLERPPAQKGN